MTRCCIGRAPQSVPDAAHVRLRLREGRSCIRRDRGARRFSDTWPETRSLFSGSLNVPVRNKIEAMVHGVRIAFQISEQPDIELSSPHGEGTSATGQSLRFRAERPNDVSIVAAPSSEPTAGGPTASTPTRGGPTGARPEYPATTCWSFLHYLRPVPRSGRHLTLGLRYEAAVETVGVPAHFANLGSFTTMFAANYLQRSDPLSAAIGSCSVSSKPFEDFEKLLTREV